MTTDTERLDWLQAHSQPLNGLRGAPGNAFVVTGHSKWTLREILDACIEAERPKELPLCPYCNGDKVRFHDGMEENCPRCHGTGRAK